MRVRSAIMALALLAPVTAFAQKPSNQASANAIRVYLDCSYFCDDQFTRTEINYVNWVRDKADAQVHVLVSQLGTGGGGSQYTLTFTGLKDFAGKEDTLRYNSHTTDSQDAVRRGLTRTIKFGLVPFIAATPDAARLQVTWGPESKEQKDAGSEAMRDPWDHWLFTISGSSNFNGEASQEFQQLYGNVSANRTTDAFKIRIGFNGNYNDSRFKYDNGNGDTTVISIRKNYSFNVLAVKSYGAHWSAGLQTGANSGTFGNIKLGLNGGPALEYSVWPYSQATRKSLTFRYSVGLRSADYRELTIYGKTQETHPSHELNVDLDLRQRFGSISVHPDFRQYLHNTSFYNASVFSNVSVKLFKGFSLEFYGEYARVHDQLSLSAANLTPEEVLLQQKQLATTYQYWGGFGLRYSFGSIFNNVVNPRFGEGGGNFIIMN